MSEDKPEQSSADFTQGVGIATIPDSGMLLGHALDKAVLRVRLGEGVHAIGATCTHHGTPLASGCSIRTSPPSRG